MRLQMAVCGATAVLAAVLPATSRAEAQHTGAECRLLAGSLGSCHFVGSPSGRASFTGTLGPDSQWTLTHAVKRFAVTAGGCTPQHADGTYDTENVTVTDEAGSGPGPVHLSNRPMIPGVLYTVSLSGGNGDLVAGTADTAAPTDVTGFHPSTRGAEDRTRGGAPSKTCSTPAPDPAPWQALVGTADPTRPPATPGIACDAGSMPETGVQGDIPAIDVSSGRVKKGYFCNARLVSQIGPGGGFRVERYVDLSGHVCGYFDSGTLFPGTVHADGSGVWVLDMSDPRHPKHVATLSTPAMLSPHESLRVNQKRGLLAADLGNPAFGPGVVDVYSIAENCLAPTFESTTPLGILGHESAFAPDGKTFYVNSTNTMMAAIDLTDPAKPQLLWVSMNWKPHGASISDDGNEMFMASYGTNGEPAGLVILNLSQIQKRLPNPQVTEISHLTWPEVSLPQNATPFRSRGHEYVIETDEFGGGSGPVGAARIINVYDLRKPFVVTHIRLAVHNQNDANKTAHYCTVPSRLDPAIIACGMLFSGLRVFDIRDVSHPREIAYTNFTGFQNTTAYQVSGGKLDEQDAGSVYSAPAFDPLHNDIWYSDGTRGFFAVHLDAASGIKRFARAYVLPGS